MERQDISKMKSSKMYQISTLQALSMGYTRPVITVSDLINHGDTGLGTFADLNGEMILIDGHCCRADVCGNIEEADADTGVPFASVAFLHGNRSAELQDPMDIDALKSRLNVLIEEEFGLNSMHMVRINGYFEEVHARSENPYRSQHISLKEILAQTQQDFLFRDIRGTLVCVYYPDYMDGINLPGWHLHFISDDRTKGGHVFQLKLLYGKALIDKIQQLEIQLPTEPAFDTYSLKEASNEEIRQAEQGEKNKRT